MKKTQQRAIIAAAEGYAKSILGTNANGHDWHHIERVRRMAARIARAEKVDPFLPELMALLHDLHDRKVVGHGNEEKGLAATRQWLEQQNLPPETIEEIMYVIENQSYSASGLRGEKLTSLAGRIMQDADRLDALGALGIARNFYFIGSRGNAIHEPSIQPRTRPLTVREYKQDRDTGINHFYEKLLKLKDLMNTKAAKRLARERHKYMRRFLREFLAEWDGKK